jgi:hypothetical protein
VHSTLLLSFFGEFLHLVKDRYPGHLNFNSYPHKGTDELSLNPNSQEGKTALAQKRVGD